MASSKGRCPALINGHLPVELQVMIYSGLSYKDILNLSEASADAKKVISENQRQIIRNVADREVPKLLQELKWFDFTEQSIVTCFRRFLSVYPIPRDALLRPIDACAQALMGRFYNIMVYDNPVLAEYNGFDVEFHLNIILCINDWIQRCDNFPSYTRYALHLYHRRWTLPLEKACGRREWGAAPEFFPGAYGPMLDMWEWESIHNGRRELSIGFTMEAFLEICDQPLQSLKPWDLAWTADGLIRPAQNDRHGGWGEPINLSRFTAVTGKERDHLETLGLPRDYKGLRVIVCTDTEEGRELLQNIEHESGQPEVMWTYLMRELKVWW